MIKEIKKRAIHRSRIIQGQMKGIEKMIEEEKYCTDILTQSLAIQKSIRSLNKLLIENHVKTHVKDDLENNPQKEVSEKLLDELLELYELSSVRS